MKTATAQLESISPYSQSRFHQTEKKDRELADDYEKRTWKEKAHFTPEGVLYIPAMAFKASLDAAAKFLSEPVKGKGKATWTKHFKSGVLVMDNLVLPGHTRDNIQGQTFLCDSKGMKGGSGGSSVLRTFPEVQKWTGTVVYHILDDTITEEVFRHHLEAAGQFMGIGRFRPQNGGFYGRYRVAALKWEEQKK